MEFQEEQSNQRRRAPLSVPLDKRIQSSYKGRLIKQRIERTKHSNIRKNYFKMLRNDAQPHDSKANNTQTETADNGNNNSDRDSDYGSDRKGSSKRKPSAPAGKHNPRANPFKAVLKDKELIQQRQDSERKAREDELSQANRRRTKYLHDRKQQRKKLNARTSRGQPIMSNQISSLLTKIRKST
ncbi:hypothetical protein LPJ59_002438 [Coemansia sp. RSA 2399]|nr:hypothetical protein LPJ59_002438 [Coemansia sp. RSA 2399]KAJ1905079.1 hypothetical protein LPJ81_002124 [Coemansia sp. IMI 209127]